MPPPAGAIPLLTRRDLALDARSLGAFRIGLGLVVMADVAARLPLLRTLASDEGPIPRNVVATQARSVFFLGFLSGSVVWSACLAGATLIAAALLVVGTRTRLVSVATWLLVGSLQVRNPLVGYGGDLLLRLVLFWAMFLPLGGAFARDVRRTGSATPPAVVPSLAYTLQLACLYAFSGSFKTSPGWRGGKALAMALVDPTWSRGIFGSDPTAVPLVGPLVGSAIPFLEVMGAVLLVVSVTRPRLRLGLLVALGLFHVGTAVVFAIHLFPWICLVALVPLLPSSVWPRTATPHVTGRPRPFRDGICAVTLAYVLLYNGMGRVVPRWDDHPVVRALGSPFERAGLRQRWNLFHGAEYGSRQARVLLLEGSTSSVVGPHGHRLRAAGPLRASVDVPFRWAKLLEALSRGPAPYAPAVAAFVCRSTQPPVAAGAEARVEVEGFPPFSAPCASLPP